MRRLLLFLIAFSTLGIQATYACSLQVSSISFEPYFWIKNGEVTGINRDFYAHIGQQINCEMHFSITPWNRVIRGLKNGDVHITSAFYKADREHFAYYSSAPISQVKFYLFGLENTTYTASLKDFFSQKKQLLYPRNWYLGGLSQELKQYPSLTHSVASLEKGIELLQKHRAQAILTSKSGLSTLLSNAKLSKQITIKSPVLSQTPIFTIVSKKGVSPDLYKKIDTAVERAIAQGVMQNIEQSYGH